MFKTNILSHLNQLSIGRIIIISIHSITKGLVGVVILVLLKVSLSSNSPQNIFQDLICGVYKGAFVKFSP